jgi:ADP-ribose pyrophosphatase YjhB (NUDIX family)
MGVLEGWKLCPRCGHELAPTHGPHLRCPACGSSYWANSSPAVQGLLVRDGRVLIGRRKIEPRKGYWDLPGGFLEEGEKPLDGLRREFREETGLHVEPVEWVGAFVDPYDGAFVLGLTWTVEAEGEPVAADDVEELAWFGPDELPGEMAFASQNEVLGLWVERIGTAARRLD